ncbi:MAG TPA: ATP-binding cassette domain-containing protein, partial [Chitinophagales bacterium]|nr:ATP-binding cassette domain-containing protein [Chitinophagales bacterium]
MKIVLSNIGKRYGLNWVFRKVNFSLEPGESYTLTGHNGSGKSTLLKILSGGLTPSEGKIEFSLGGKEVTPYNIASEIAFTAPYIHLIEDFTLQEMLEFHFKFKKMRVQSIDELMNIIGLEEHRDKYLSNFS